MGAIPTKNESPFNGAVRFNVSASLGDGKPLDTAMVREALVNNVTALQQGSVQMRVSTDSPQTLLSQVGFTTHPKTLVASFPIALTQLQNGTLAPVWFSCRHYTNGPSATANWTVRLRRQGDSPLAVGTTNVDTMLFPVTYDGTFTVHELTGTLYIPTTKIGSPNPVPCRSSWGSTAVDAATMVYANLLDIFVEITTTSTNSIDLNLLGLTVLELPFQAAPVV